MTSYTVRLVCAGLVVVVAGAFTAGCSSTDSTAEPDAGETAGPDASRNLLADVSRPHLARCLEVVQICPRRAPKTSDYVAREIDRLRLPYSTFELRSGWPYGDPAKNRPPAFAHVVVEVGDVKAALGFPLEELPEVIPSSEATLDRDRRDSANLGSVEWGGRSGTLLLAPSFARASTIHGDHLIFVAPKGNPEFLISLHAWYPQQAIEALRQIVETTDVAA